MARYIKLDQDKINRLKREAQQFQDDIVCGVGTDFMQKIAEAENRMIFDILKGLEDDSTADVVPKSEVDKWFRECEVLQGRFIELEKEVAREIFEELELLMKIYTFPVVKLGVIEIVKEPFWCIEPNDFETLKKKYTESEE